MKQTTASDSQEPLRESDSRHRPDEETSGLFWWSLEKGNGSTGAGTGRGHGRLKQVKLCHLALFPQIEFAYSICGSPRDQFVVTSKFGWVWRVFCLVFPFSFEKKVVTILLAHQEDLKV